MAKRTTEGNTKGRKKTVNIQSRGVIIKGKHWKREDNDTKILDDPRVKTQISSQVKQQGKTVKIPGGRGLGKAGAKRLGKLLKRAIQEKKNVTGNEKLPLPTTPVRLFKYQTQKGKVVTRVSQLILRVVSQCKSRGGISMVELKQALSAGGYDVTKNNSRVNLAVKGLVTKATLLQTMGGGASWSFRLNKKNRSDEKNVKTRAMRKREKLWRSSVPTVEKRKAARTAVTKAKPAGKSPTRDRRDAKSATKVRGNGYKTRRQQKTARSIHKNTITDLGNKKSRIQRRRTAK